MRLEAAILGNLKELLREEADRAAKAVSAGVREAGQGARQDLAAHLQQADLGKLSRAVGHKHYRGRRSPLDAASIVYIKGRAARQAVWAFENGAVIRPKSGRYLAIPTQYNRASGRRGGRVLFRPDQLRDSFVQRSQDGSLLLFARVSQAQRMVRGRVRNQAFVEGHLLGSGRVKRTASILQAGVVPMFILKPQVVISKRLDVAAIAKRWQERLPELIVQHWEALENGR